MVRTKALHLLFHDDEVIICSIFLMRMVSHIGGRLKVYGFYYVLQRGKPHIR